MLNFHEIQIHPQVEAILALLKARASELSADVYVQVKSFQLAFERGYVIELIGIDGYGLDEHKYLAIATSSSLEGSFVLYHMYEGNYTDAEHAPSKFWQIYDLYHFDKIYDVVSKILAELREAVKPYES